MEVRRCCWRTAWRRGCWCFIRNDSCFQSIKILGAVAAVVGGGAVLLTRLIMKKKNNFNAVKQFDQIEGWERVEHLIMELDRQRADLLKTPTVKDFNNAHNGYRSNINNFGMGLHMVIMKAH